MKKFASIIIVIVMFVLCFALSACGNKYHSKYNSTLMVEEKTTNKASVSFDSFNGTYVIKFRNTGSDKVCISYKAALKEGSFKAYYDFNDEKLDLFEIGADGSVEGKTEAFAGDKIIYIIIESDGKCNEGSFSFTLEKSK